MATLYWQGTAPLVAQAASTTITGNDVATTYKVTIGGVTVSVAGNAGGVNNTATDLAAALNASTNPYFAAITWAANTATVTGTADTAGCPFVFTTSVAGGGGTIGAYTAVTANSGPNDLSVAANWSTGTVPVDGDTVIFANNSVSACWGLDMASIQPALLRIDQTYTGYIGLEGGFATTSAGAGNTTEAVEYREQYWKIGPVLCQIGQNFSPSTATGSGRIKLNTGTDACLFTVFNSAAQSADTNLPAIRLLANDNATDINVRSAPGGLGLAVGPGETSTINDMYITDTTSASQVFFGPGCTLDNWEQLGGNAILSYTALTSVSQSGGTLTINGTANIGTIEVYGGICYCNVVGGTITTLTFDRGGTVNTTALQGALIATNLYFGSGTLIQGAYGITSSGGITFNLPSTITLANA